MSNKQLRSPRAVWWILVLAAVLPPVPLRGSAQVTTVPKQTTQQASATVAKYCATCHNARMHTANLVLDPSSMDRVPADAEQWEKVIRKLESRSMPPAGAPRPDA